MTHSNQNPLRVPFKRILRPESRSEVALALQDAQPPDDSSLGNERLILHQELY